MTDQLSDTRTHHHSPDPLRNHGYNDVCSCGVRIHRDADGTWAPDNPSTDATCKTCPWCGLHSGDSTDDVYGYCRKMPPGTMGHFVLVVLDEDWCGEHPDRQPHLECATATLVTHDDDGPTAADMRRIVDALEKMATCAAVKP